MMTSYCDLSLAHQRLAKSAMLTKVTNAASQQHQTHASLVPNGSPLTVTGRDRVVKRGHTTLITTIGGSPIRKVTAGSNRCSAEAGSSRHRVRDIVSISNAWATVTLTLHS